MVKTHEADFGGSVQVSNQNNRRNTGGPRLDVFSSATKKQMESTEKRNSCQWAGEKNHTDKDEESSCRFRHAQDGVYVIDDGKVTPAWSIAAQKICSAVGASCVEYFRSWFIKTKPVMFFTLHTSAMVSSRKSLKNWNCGMYRDVKQRNMWNNSSISLGWCLK